MELWERNQNKGQKIQSNILVQNLITQESTWGGCIRYNLRKMNPYYTFQFNRLKA